LCLSSLALGFANPEALAQGARSDERNDLIRGCTGEPPSQNLIDKAGFVDIVQASASVEGSYLVLKLKTAEPIPTQARNLVSYSFLLDLDGDKGTGFIGNRSPLGAFPGLGIDLWVNYSHYRGEREDFGFLGSPGIPNLNPTPTLTNYQLKNGRRILEITVPISRVEMKLKYNYMILSPPWEVKPEKMEWVAFTSWAPLRRSNPVTDVLPENYYSPSRRGCLMNPLVEFFEGEETEGEEKEPPPPPDPPEPPS